MDKRGVVLIVEDNADHIDLTRRVLRKVDSSLRLVAASSGLEAMSMFLGNGVFARKKTRPFLILLDLHLPQLSGLTMLSLFHADPHIQSIPIVVVTASTDNVVELETENFDANDFVRKPMTVEKMQQLISMYRPNSS